MLKETKDGILIPIKVIPKASCNAIVGWEGEELKVRVRAPADKGKANEELIAYLSKTWKIPKSYFLIHSGETSRHKRLCIQHCNLETLKQIVGL